MAASGKEIERKYLVNDDLLPKNLKDYPQKQMIQGYLSYQPEIRIRAVRQNGETLYYQTKKGEGTLERDEDEKEIPAEDFYEKLKRIDNDSLIRKTRYEIPLEEGRTAELNFFENPELEDYAGANTGKLKMVEVEFPDKAMSEKFKKPEWFGKEVTEDKAYKNKNIAKAIKADREKISQENTL